MDAKNSPKNVLVLGATGYQGNHVARLLLKKGHKVTALTRNPNNIHAQQLEKAGQRLCKEISPTEARLKMLCRAEMLSSL